MESDAIAVMKVWAVGQSPICIMRDDKKGSMFFVKPKNNAIPFFILTHPISIEFMNGEKIMKADAIAVTKF